MEEKGAELTSIDVYLVQTMDFKLPADKVKKPTWKTDAFNLSFTANLTSKPLGARFREYPTWLAHFMKTECIYRNSACVKLTREEDDLAFAAEFAAAFEPLEQAAIGRNQSKANRGSNIGSAVNSSSASSNATGARDEQDEADGDSESLSHSEIDLSNLEAWLFYEINLRQWQIIYKFSITTTAQHLNDLIVASPGLRSKRQDLYNIIRDLFTESTAARTPDADIQAIPSVRMVQKRAMARALELCRTLYGLKKSVKATDILTFPQSCTDVSFFIGSSAARQLKNVLVRETALAERKHEAVLDLFGKKRGEREGYRDVELFQFGDRFNTILIECDAIDALGGPSDVLQGYQAQFMPTLFHSMLMRSYLGRMTEAMQVLERDMLAGERTKTSSQVHYFDSLINSSEYASFENETFKRGIRQDSELIYAKVEKKWGIQRSLAQMKDFASYLATCLDRSYQDRALKSNRKRNAVLILIAILGLFGLSSIWVDYPGLIASLIETFHALN